MEVTFNGQSYPIKLTMGAIIDFKHLTGKDPSKIAADDVEGLTALCYCCLCSAIRAAGREFSFSFQQFADACSIDELNAMNVEIAEQQESEAAKKSNCFPGRGTEPGTKHRRSARNRARGDGNEYGFIPALHPGRVPGSL